MEQEKLARKRERDRARSKRWRQLHPDRYREQAIQQNLKRKATKPWKLYVNGANRRGLQYNMSDELAEQTMRMPCHYCGQSGGPFVGIDRKDNNVGYTPANILPCCKRCNWAKGTSRYEEFQEYIHALAFFVYTNRKRKNGIKAD